MPCNIFFNHFSPQKTGTGLGLAMEYGFVSYSLGYIKLDSKLGIGTTFKIYLPKTEISR